MTTTIHCYSATGNSLAIARQVADELGDCEIVSMSARQADRPVGGAGERIGFVFPVYYAGLPRLVAKYVEELEALPETDCFALATCRDPVSSRFTMDDLDGVLRSKGASLSYADLLRMPGSYAVMYQPPSPEEARELVESARERAEDFARAIASGASYRDKGKKSCITWAQKILMNIYTSTDFLIRSQFTDAFAWERKFVSDEKCTGCKTCARVCPVGNINMEEGRPAWRHDCQRCLACLHWCPQEAIQYGRITVRRRRYHHPDIEAKDIIELSSHARDLVVE